MEKEIYRYLKWLSFFYFLSNFTLTSIEEWKGRQCLLFKEYVNKKIIIKVFYYSTQTNKHGTKKYKFIWKKLWGSAQKILSSTKSGFSES